MKRVKKYDDKVVYAHIPTLAEAQKHYEQTGEFIISANTSDPNEGFEGENVNDALENNGISVIDKVELGIREADPRNIIQPTPAPSPAPSDPAPAPAPAGAVDPA